MNSRLLSCIVVSVFLLGIIGCSKHPDHVPVTVQINDKGVPVEGVSITFVAEDGSYAVGYTDDKGVAAMYTYEPEDGVKKGSYLVRLSKYEKIAAPTGEYDPATDSYGPGTNAPVNPNPPPLIPEKFLDPATSGLSVVVEKEIPLLVFDVGEGE